MAKRGRPAAAGDRYECGKLRPSNDGAAPMSGALWQRIVANAEKVLGDPKFGTELSRLGVTGQLTGSEVATGFRIAGIYGRFEYYKGLSRSAASPHYIREYISEGAGSDTEMVNLGVAGGRDRDRSFLAEDREQREIEATAAFNDLQNFILPHHRPVLERLCVENRHIGFEGLAVVRIAFAALKLYFADKDGGKGRSRKAQRKPQKRPAEPPAPNIVLRVNPLKTAFLALQRKLSPQLSDDELERVWTTLCALKDRNDFRLAKSEGGSTS